jgi:hypothetical protein
MGKIIIKEIDVFKSKLFKNKTISEYLISVILNDICVSAYTEIGEVAKKERVNELLVKFFINDNRPSINIEDIITEIKIQDKQIQNAK